MRIAVITATPQTVERGSGTFVATAALRQGLEELGHETRMIRPARRPGRLGYTWHRFVFNRGLRSRHVTGADLVVGLDMDGYRLAGATTPPFVAYIHGQLADEARFERGAVAATMRLQARAERRSARRAQRVITVSEYSRRGIARQYGVDPARIAVVPPTFDAVRWDAALRRVAGPPADRPTVLCVARMYRRKNIGALLRAATLLRERIPDVVLEIAGDGPERRRLEQLARTLDLGRSVRFRGHVDFPTLVEAYARCEVFCLPSLQEGFGLVYLEAMAAGKPIVACRGTAGEELVEHGVNGFLAPPHDAAALAEALIRLLRDPRGRRAMGAANRGRLAAYAPTTVARQFLQAAQTGET
jgi:glycosyltransferase involved in cell wall biosynthesis